jgi:SAM-dependent methyltransferase
MLEMASVGPTDVVLDLGSGDGRLVIGAARRFGARGFGIDIDAALVQLANDNARQAGVSDRVQFRRADLFETDVRDATVVTLYLLPEAVARLVPRLQDELGVGSRIVSHDYPLEPWRPTRIERFDVPEKVAINGTPETFLFLYVVPARLGGSWEGQFPANISTQPARLAFKQDRRETRGALTIDGRTAALTDLNLIGANLSFSLLTAPGKTVRVRGVVNGDEIRGTVVSAEGEQSWEARRQR